ncbi:MAG: cytochrome c [Myxococcaceae bacterium]|nr:cytochrome c [Myxococcaceae bacterium]
MKRWSVSLCVVGLAGCQVRQHDLGPQPQVSRLPQCVGDVSTEPVVEPVVAPPAISGGTLAVMGDGTMVVADPDRDQLYVVGTDDEVATVPLEAGAEPGRVIEGPAARALVVLRRRPQVVELDVGAATIVARHSVCAVPRGIAWAPAPRATLYVACAGGELARLVWNGSVFTPGNTTMVVPDLRDVVVTPNGVLVSTFRSAELYTVSESGAVVRHAVTGVGSEAPHVAWRMAAGPGGKVAISHQTATSESLGLAACVDTAEEAEALGADAGFGYGGSGGAIIPSVTTVDVSGGHPEPVGTWQLFGAGALPVDTAYSASGMRLAVVLAGSQVVHVQEPVQGGVRTTPLVMKAPTAVGFRGEAVVVFNREPAQLVIEPGTSSARTISLSTLSRRSTSHELFHQATGSALACASCHPEAGDDGFTWTIGGELFRTPTLRGGLGGTEPFHWKGDQADVTALMGDVFRKRMLGPKLSQPQAEALLGWLDAQPRLPAPTLDSASVARGRDLFESTQVGCAACHVGAHGTNNASADVGTGGAFQVPRLDELAYRAPYLHDGSAASIEQRLEVGGDGVHGRTVQLTVGERADLAAYLRSR